MAVQCSLHQRLLRTSLHQFVWCTKILYIFPFETIDWHEIRKKNINNPKKHIRKNNICMLVIFEPTTRVSTLKRRSYATLALYLRHVSCLLYLHLQSACILIGYRSVPRDISLSACSVFPCVPPHSRIPDRWKCSIFIILNQGGQSRLPSRWGRLKSLWTNLTPQETLSRSSL